MWILRTIVVSSLLLTPQLLSAQQTLRAADGRALSIVADACAATWQYGDDYIGDECLRYGMALLRSGDEDAASQAFARACRLRSRAGCRMAVEISRGLDSAIAATSMPVVRDCDAGSWVTCPEPMRPAGEVFSYDGPRVELLLLRDLVECRYAATVASDEWTRPSSEACQTARNYFSRPEFSRLGIGRPGGIFADSRGDALVNTRPSDAETYGSTNSQGSVPVRAPNP